MSHRLFRDVFCGLGGDDLLQEERVEGGSGRRGGLFGVFFFGRGEGEEEEGGKREGRGGEGGGLCVGVCVEKPARPAYQGHRSP